MSLDTYHLFVLILLGIIAFGVTGLCLRLAVVRPEEFLGGVFYTAIVFAIFFLIFGFVVGWMTQ